MYLGESHAMILLDKTNLYNVDHMENHRAQQDLSLSYLQRLVVTIRACLHELGNVYATNSQLEAWAVLIHESMSAHGRNFHSVRHVFDISEGAAALTTISALFHDVIYYNVDGGLSPKQAEILRGVISEEREATSFLTLNHFNAKDDRLLAMVADVFGFQSGQTLSPFSGENEFMSAVVAVRLLEGTLEPAYLAQIAACIEATIPFRKKDDQGRTPPEFLYERLTKANIDYDLGMTNEEIVETIHHAVDLCNRDVGNFGTTDRAWFLDNTWKLLPESNIPLRHKALYTVFDYQLALKKMECFFNHLDPSVVFRSFRDRPDEATFVGMTRRARRNVEVGRRYIQVKLLSLSVLAAMAELTGGDAPIALFKGDLPGPDHNTVRLDDSIPIITHKVKILDAEVYELLAEGRKSDSKFEMRNSPLAAYLYALMGDEGVEKALSYCVHPMDEVNAKRLIVSIPRIAATVIATETAKIALTRADKLRKLLKDLSWPPAACNSRRLSSHI